MWKYLALVACCAVVLAVPTALADESQSSGTVSSTQCSTRSELKATFAHKHWREKHPAARVQCYEASLRPFVKRLRASLATYREYRLIARIRGFRGEGEYLEWLPIPRYVVDCETNGSHGDGRWRARNASGAQGPAQLLGWNAPYPAMSDSERLAYWQETLYVLHVQGLAAWSCA